MDSILKNRAIHTPTSLSKQYRRREKRDCTQTENTRFQIIKSSRKTQTSNGLHAFLAPPYVYKTYSACVYWADKKAINWVVPHVGVIIFYNNTHSANGNVHKTLIKHVLRTLYATRGLSASALGQFAPSLHKIEATKRWPLTSEGPVTTSVECVTH
jgi:hypothetical protein